MPNPSILNITKRNTTCRLCLKFIERGQPRLLSIRGNLDRRFYHVQCACDAGFVLSEEQIGGVPEQVGKDTLTMFQSNTPKATPVLKGTKKRANSDDGGRKKKKSRIKQSEKYRRTFKNLMIKKNLGDLKKLTLNELQALCLYNNVGVFTVDFEKMVISITKDKCLRQLQRIAVLGPQEKPCVCGGLFEYEVPKHSYDRDSTTFKNHGGGIRCMGTLKGHAWLKCTQDRPTATVGSVDYRHKERFSAPSEFPRPLTPIALDFPNPFAIDEVELLTTLLQKPIKIDGYRFELSSSLIQEIVAFLKPLPEHFVDVHLGKFSKWSMPNTTGFTIADWRKKKLKKK